jgi:hypothetical protein
VTGKVHVKHMSQARRLQQNVEGAAGQGKTKAKGRGQKFQKRYVLGEGFPWAIGTAPYKEIGLSQSQLGVLLNALYFPSELWSKDVPRYRLVLERVDRKAKP